MSFNRLCFFLPLVTHVKARRSTKNVLVIKCNLNSNECTNFSLYSDGWLITNKDMDSKIYNCISNTLLKISYRSPLTFDRSIERVNRHNVRQGNRGVDLLGGRSLPLQDHWLRRFSYLRHRTLVLTLHRVDEAPYSHPSSHGLLVSSPDGNRSSSLVRLETVLT